MARYRLTRKARRDLYDIWLYIAADSERQADRFIDRLTENFGLLGRNPLIGRERQDLRSGYRSFPVGSYLIFYRVRNPGVEISRVLHGGRDLPPLLRS